MPLVLQRLKLGDDPATAFLTSSGAALDGAESTKKMRAKVTFIIVSLLRGETFCVQILPSK